MPETRWKVRTYTEGSNIHMGAVACAYLHTESTHIHKIDEFFFNSFKKKYAGLG